MMAQRRWRVGLDEFAGCMPVEMHAQCSNLDKLGVAALRDDAPPLPGDNLVDAALGERQGPANLGRYAFDLDLVALARRALVRDVNVGTDAGVGALVPRRDGHAAYPVEERGRRRTMDAAMRIDMVLGQDHTRAHDALGRVGELDVGEDQLIDGAVRQAASPVLLDKGQELGVVGGLGHCQIGDVVEEGRRPRRDRPKKRRSRPAQCFTGPGTQGAGATSRPDSPNQPAPTGVKRC